MKSTYAAATFELRRELNSFLDRKTLIQLHTKQPLRHGFALFRQIILLSMSSVVLWLFSDPLTVILAATVSGFTLFNFTVLLHEQLHDLIFQKPHPVLNRVLGQIYAFFSGISCAQFTRWHMDHHYQLGSDTLDPKRHHLSPRRNSRFIKLLYFTPALFWIYFRAAARETSTYEPVLRAKIARERITSLLGHILMQAGLIYFVSPGAWFRVYVIPMVIVFPVAFALNRLGQHYAIKENDPAGWTTWVRSSRFWNFVYLNSNLHLEHHYYPGVPFYHLPGLQKLLIPFYSKHGLKPYGYAKLLVGYLVENHRPHSDWEQTG